MKYRGSIEDLGLGAVFQFSKPCKFRTIVCGNGAKHLAEVVTLVSLYLLKGIYHRLGRFVRQAQDEELFAFSLQKSQLNIVAAGLLTKDHFILQNT